MGAMSAEPAREPAAACLTPSEVEAFAALPAVGGGPGSTEGAAGLAGAAAHLRRCARCAAAVSEARETREFLARVAPALRPEESDTSSLAGYDLVAPIGDGGQGTVWRAVHRPSGRAAAVKVVRHATASQRLRMQREARLAAALRHPGIVSVYDCGALPDAGFAIAMELVDGVPFDRWAATVRSQLPDPAARTRRLVQAVVQVAEALHHAHQHGVIHRDLKPANVLVTADGQPRIVDFGLARQLSPDSGWTVTRPGEFAGTLAYAAPEQLSGSELPGSPADVYALGALLHEVISGAPPVDGSLSLDALLERILRAPPAPLLRDACGDRVDPDLATIVATAMEREPARRYDSAAAFRADLERWLDGRPILARPAGAVELARKLIRRHPLASSAAAVALMAAVAFVATLVVLLRRASDDAERFRTLYLNANGAVERSIDTATSTHQRLEEVQARLTAERTAREAAEAALRSAQREELRRSLALAAALAASGRREEARRVAWAAALAPSVGPVDPASPLFSELLAGLRAAGGGGAPGAPDALIATEVEPWILRLQREGCTLCNEAAMRSWAAKVLGAAKTPPPPAGG